MSSRVRFNWGDRETEALISGYEELRHLECHPTKKKTFWKKVVDFVHQQVGVQVPEEKAKEKWKRLKEAYGDARLKMNSSGETFSNFKYFEELDKIFGARPIVSTGESMSLGATRNIPQNEDDIVDDDVVLMDESHLNDYSNNAEEIDNQRNISVSSGVLEEENASLPTNSTGYKRRRRRRENNFEKFLTLKREELNLQREKLQYLKERDTMREQNKLKRHQERRNDMFRLMGVTERDED